MNVAKTMMNAASMADVADDLTLRANGSVNVKPPTILHFIGNLGGGGAEMMMRYYWHTIDACVPPQSILDAMDRAGLRMAPRKTYFGLFSEYLGARP